MTSTLGRSIRRLAAMSLVMAMVASIGLGHPASAVAGPKKARTITRQMVMKRAKHWVKKRVPYSQSRYHQGYRQDCSGFVSMAWQMGTSYTTRSLPSAARRISLRKIRVGDAVLAPGHVTIFGGWKNRAKRQYYAYEEPTWGKTAQRRVRILPSGANIYRRPGIRDARKKAPRPRPTPPVPVPTTPPVSVPSTSVVTPTPDASITTSSMTPTI